MANKSKNEYNPLGYINNPVGMLAAEIVAQAVEDWRTLVKKKAWLPSVPVSTHCNFNDIRSFLRSEWCELLLLPCEMDAQRILQILEEELREAQRKDEEGKDEKQ